MENSPCGRCTEDHVNIMLSLNTLTSMQKKKKPCNLCNKICTTDIFHIFIQLQVFIVFVYIHIWTWCDRKKTFLNKSSCGFQIFAHKSSYRSCGLCQQAIQLRYHTQAGWRSENLSSYFGRMIASSVSGQGHEEIDGHDLLGPTSSGAI